MFTIFIPVPVLVLIDLIISFSLLTLLICWRESPKYIYKKEQYYPKDRNYNGNGADPIFTRTVRREVKRNDFITLLLYFSYVGLHVIIHIIIFNVYL